MKGKSKLSTLVLIALLSVFTLLSSCTQEEEISIEDQLLELIETSSLDHNVLILNGIRNNQLIYDIKDGFDYGFVSRSTGVEVCRGNGYVFTRCIKQAMDGGLCLVTYAHGGEYVAEEIECPFNQ